MAMLNVQIRRLNPRHRLSAAARTWSPTPSGLIALRPNYASMGRHIGDKRRKAFRLVSIQPVATVGVKQRSAYNTSMAPARPVIAGRDWGVERRRLLEEGLGLSTTLRAGLFALQSLGTHDEVERVGVGRAVPLTAQALCAVHGNAQHRRKIYDARCRPVPRQCRAADIRSDPPRVV